MFFKQKRVQIPDGSHIKYCIDCCTEAIYIAVATTT